MPGVGLVVNAARTLTPSWIGVFLTSDLVFHQIAVQLIVLVIFSWLGALETMPGQVAVAIMIASSLVLLKVGWPALRSQAFMN